MQSRLIKSRTVSAILIASLCIPVAPVRAANTGTCTDGNCVTGVGSLQLSNGIYTGKWLNRNFVAGRYAVKYNAFPGQAFDLEVDTNGLPVRGTVVQDGDQMHGDTIFTGKFERFSHPYDGTTGARFSQGRYTDSAGLVYEGSFEFIPRPFGGHYVMNGVRIDEKSDEVRAGLFVSDDTWYETTVGGKRNSVMSSAVFHRATADYLITLQNEIRSQIAKTNAEEAARMARQRESRESWSNFLTAAVGVAAIVGIVAYASRGSGSAAANVGDAMRGGQSSNDSTAKLVASLREQSKTDQALAARIGKASDSEVISMMRQSRPPTMSLKEYQGAISSGQAPASPFQQGASMSSALSSPKQSYVSEIDRGYFGRGASEAEGCAVANSLVKEGPPPTLAVKVLSYRTTGPCTCKHVYEPGFGAARPAIDYYGCTIPAVVQIETDTDPNLSKQPGRSAGRVQ